MVFSEQVSSQFASSDSTAKQGARSKKAKDVAHVVTSLQVTMMALVALTLLTTLTAFSEFTRLANTSKFETLRYLTNVCVLVPLIAAFVCQPKFIARLLNDKRLQRVFLAEQLSEEVNLPNHVLAKAHVGTIPAGPSQILRHIQELEVNCKPSRGAPDCDSTDSNTPQHQDQVTPSIFKFPTDDSTYPDDCTTQAESNRSSNNSIDDFHGPASTPFAPANDAPRTRTPSRSAPAFEPEEEALPAWTVFKNLMSPLEYLLFAMNMVFFADYCLKQHVATTEDLGLFALGYSEEALVALQVMAMVDQLLLFFFGLKVCLAFSQNVTLDIFAAEIKAELREEEARLMAASLTPAPKLPTTAKSGKALKKTFKPGNSSQSTAERLTDEERKMMADYQFYESLKRAR